LWDGQPFVNPVGYDPPILFPFLEWVYVRSWFSLPSLSLSPFFHQGHRFYILGGVYYKPKSPPLFLFWRTLIGRLPTVTFTPLPSQFSLLCASQGLVISFLTFPPWEWAGVCSRSISHLGPVSDKVWLLRWPYRCS